MELTTRPAPPSAHLPICPSSSCLQCLHCLFPRAPFSKLRSASSVYCCEQPWCRALRTGVHSTCGVVRQAAAQGGSTAAGGSARAAAQGRRAARAVPGSRPFPGLVQSLTSARAQGAVHRPGGARQRRPQARPQHGAAQGDAPHRRQLLPPAGKPPAAPTVVVAEDGVSCARRHPRLCPDLPGCTSPACCLNRLLARLAPAHCPQVVLAPWYQLGAPTCLLPSVFFIHALPATPAPQTQRHAAARSRRNSASILLIASWKPPCQPALCLSRRCEHAPPAPAVGTMRCLLHQYPPATSAQTCR